MVTQNYTISTVKTATPPKVKMSQYDYGMRTITFAVVDGSGAAVDLTGKTVTVEGTRIDGHAFAAACTVSGSTVSFVETVDMTNQAGDHPAELVVRESGQRLGTMNFVLAVEAAAMDENAEITEEDQSLFDQLYTSIDDAVAEVDTARDTALAKIEQGLASGSPLVANTAAEMTDTDEVYLYTGSESGYTAGSWYYYNGTTWVVGGVYGAGTTDTTLTLAGVAADAKATGDAVRNFAEQFIYEQYTPTDGSLLPLSANTGDRITIKRVDGQAFTHGDQVRFYDVNRNYLTYYSCAVGSTSRTITYDKSTAAVYVGITYITTDKPELYVINNSSKSLMLNEINERKSADTVFNNRLDILDEQSAKANIINRFNKATISEGKYIATSNGDLLNNASFFASDYIYIGDLDTVTVSYTHIFGWYNANKAWIGHPDAMNSRGSDMTFEVPDGAVYLRFSTYNGDLNLAQIGDEITRNNYVQYGIYILPGLRVTQSQISGEDVGIIVDASGDGDYTSFTRAIYENVDSGVNVFVKPGTYNIVAEYVDLFGQEAVNNMADADSATFNGFQYGVRLRNRKVKFASGAHLVCDWTGHTVDGTHRFSALGVDYNVEIIGLDLDATATFYCIHDDYGIDTPYTVKYENCRVIGHNIYNADCIGGGCKKYSRHVLNNCYFDNNLTNSATVRYHNTNSEGAEPEIYVSNCYFNNWFTPRWFGTQTSKMRVYVNNCEARSIHKLAESSSYNVDNVELYKWCNTETNPVT